MDTLLQVLEDEPVPPKQMNKTVDLDLQTVTLKCLDKDPLRRYSSAAHLAEDLERFLNLEPVTARPIGAMERLWRDIKWRPVSSLLLSGMVLVLIALGMLKLTEIVNATIGRSGAFGLIFGLSLTIFLGLTLKRFIDYRWVSRLRRQRTGQLHPKSEEDFQR